MATLDEHRDALAQVEKRRKELDEEYQGEALPDGARAEFENLTADKQRLEDLIEELEWRHQQLADESEKPASREGGAGFYTQRKPAKSEIYDIAEIRSRAGGDPERINEGMRTNALRSVEETKFLSPTHTHEQVQDNIQHLLDTTRGESTTSEIAHRILATGSPAYKRAFGKVISGKMLNSEEQRAMSTTAGSGGYAVPYALDPTIMRVSNWSVNPYRAICRIASITGSNTWQGVTTQGGTATRVIEAGTATDGAPAFLQPTAQVTRVHHMIPFSYEIEGDIAGLAGELTQIFQDAKDDEEALNFSTGSGTAPTPIGIVGAQGLGTAAPPKQVTAGSAVLAVGDLDNAQALLGARWRSRASWVANLGFYNRVRRLYTAGGETLEPNAGPGNVQGFNSVAPGGATVGYNLLGRPAYECSGINSTNVMTAGTKIAVFGDWSQFIIVDRVGMNVEVIPNLMSTLYPTGQRALYAWWRNTTVLVTGTGAGAFVYVQTL